MEALQSPANKSLLQTDQAINVRGGKPPNPYVAPPVKSAHIGFSPFLAASVPPSGRSKRQAGPERTCLRHWSRRHAVFPVRRAVLGMSLPPQNYFPTAGAARDSVVLRA